MSYFTVFVYSKMTKNVNHAANGVWSVSLPQSLSINDGFIRAIRTLKYHLVKETSLTRNAASELVEFGASLRNRANSSQTQQLIETPRQQPIEKVSDRVFDDMIPRQVDLAAVDDDDLIKEVRRRLSNAESTVSYRQVLSLTETGDVRSLVMNLDDFQSLLSDAEIDIDELGRDKALAMMELLLTRLYYNPNTLDLVKTLALESGLKTQSPLLKINM